MKIYINNFNLDILGNVMNLFSDYLFNYDMYIQIYSTSGIYQIDSLTTNKLNPVDNEIKIIKNYYKDFEFILDYSYYTLVKETTIDPDHICKKIKKSFYRINKSSNINLMIECEIKEENNKEIIVPYDIYFELPNEKDINDPLVKQEIIVFLSLLN